MKTIRLGPVEISGQGRDEPVCWPLASGNPPRSTCPGRRGAHARRYRRAGDLRLCNGIDVLRGEVPAGVALTWQQVPVAPRPRPPCSRLGATPAGTSLPTGQGVPVALADSTALPGGCGRSARSWRRLPNLGQGGRVRKRHGNALRHRFDHRNAETLAKRREDKRRRLRIGRAQGPALAISRQAHKHPPIEPLDLGPKSVLLYLRTVAEQHQRQLPARDLRHQGRSTNQPGKVLAGLEIGHREYERNPRRQTQVGMRLAALAVRGRLKKQVLGGVRNVLHPAGALGKELQKPSRVEVRDREDQIRPRERPCKPVARPRGAGAGTRVEAEPCSARRRGPSATANPPCHASEVPCTLASDSKANPPALSTIRPAASESIATSGARPGYAREARACGLHPAIPSRPVRPAPSSGPRPGAARFRRDSASGRSGPRRAGSHPSGSGRRPCRKPGRPSSRISTSSSTPPYRKRHSASSVARDPAVHQTTHPKTTARHANTPSTIHQGLRRGASSSERYWPQPGHHSTSSVNRGVECGQGTVVADFLVIVGVFDAFCYSTCSASRSSSTSASRHDMRSILPTLGLSTTT